MENHYGERIPMQRYFSAVRNMEQTVMFPSLLQGVLLEDQDDPAGVNAAMERSCDRDLYHYYTLLKSVKLTVESGLPPLNDKSLRSKEEEEEEAAKEKTDLEGLVRYHISGLYHVLAQLTSRANTVTSRYNEILGQINQNGIAFRW
ncbi:thyroid hormone-inducible hepatic protein [Protobothrops mucrosquamatus]|uniref:thyroid hormone-inducible hepatic protein n=1 Tax=Protobothrops mucrosquamatus TaxID=103944 RepID=UPI000775BD9B|nr:thyroid hormone-inducible hepatic protein [Protobothrops mucrosquamatus]